MALLSERQVTMVTLIVIVVTLLIGGGVMYYFEFKILPEKDKGIKKLENEIDEAQKKIGGIDELQEEIKELIVKEKLEKDKIPTFSKEEYDRFADTLGDIVKKAGISVEGIKLTLPKKEANIPGVKTSILPANIGKVVCELKITGNFSQLAEFIKLVESSQRFMVIEQYDITRGKELELGKEKGVSKLAAKLTISTYTYKAPGELEKKIKEKISNTTPIPD